MHFDLVRRNLDANADIMRLSKADVVARWTIACVIGACAMCWMLVEPADLDDTCTTIAMYPPLASPISAMLSTRSRLVVSVKVRFYKLAREAGEGTPQGDLQQPRLSLSERVPVLAQPWIGQLPA